MRSLQAMTNPVYQKLKSDAGVVLTDLWRALRHQAPVEDWQHTRSSVSAKKRVAPNANMVRPQSSGLCYFHLN